MSPANEDAARASVPLLLAAGLDAAFVAGDVRAHQAAAVCRMNGGSHEQGQTGPEAPQPHGRGEADPEAVPAADLHPLRSGGAGGGTAAGVPAVQGHTPKEGRQGRSEEVTALVVSLAPRGWRCQVLRPGLAWDVYVEAYAPPQRRGRWAKPDGNERGIVSLRVRGDHVRAEVDAGGPRWLDAAADRWEDRVFVALAGRCATTTT